MWFLVFMLLFACALLTAMLIYLFVTSSSHIRVVTEKIRIVRARVDELAKYEPIEDVDAAIAKHRTQAELLLANRRAEIDEHKRSMDQKIRDGAADAQRIIDSEREKAEVEIRANRKKAREAKKKYEELLGNASEQARKVLQDAEFRAQEVAGEALEAKRNADRYEMAIRALKNTIGGYGDEYLIPHSEIIDALAEDYSHKEAGKELKNARDRTGQMVKTGTAAACDYSEARRRQTAVRFALDAFNGKVDSILSTAKHNNFGKLRQQIADAYGLVNLHGEAFRNARITQEYFTSRMEELQWLVTTNDLRREEQEEQRRIRQEMREEERARREYEKAQKEAAKEQHMLEQAMAKAKAELAAASAEQKAKFEAQVKELESQIVAVEDKHAKAISLAQLTRRGYVYVISNIGSFGEDVYKIGLTRRFEPLDRVKELGDASVPFEFDVHAMIYSEDAPTLETTLQKRFEAGRVNKVNSRKEFFRTGLLPIKEVVDGLDVEVHWTMKAEAREYRETVAMEKKVEGATDMASSMARVQ
jgi:Meiotically up-regulated gene 113/Domain of unknown function (DUF4041)